MFARSVSIRLKTNSVAEFTRLIEKDALPLLRRQKGFHDELVRRPRRKGSRRHQFVG